MKKLFLSLTMLLAMGLSVSGVAAQEMPVAEMPEGIESGYMRNYAPEQSSPEAGEGITFSLDSIMVAGMTFENDDQAEDAFKMLKDELPASMGEDAKVEDADYGDEGMMADMSVEGMGMTVISFRDDNVIFSIISMGEDADAVKSQAEGVAKYIDDADMSDSEVDFKEDGTSTGGVFDMMPPAGEDFLNGMVPSADTDMLAGQ